MHPADALRTNAPVTIASQRAHRCFMTILLVRPSPSGVWTLALESLQQTDQCRRTPSVMRVMYPTCSLIAQRGSRRLFDVFSAWTYPAGRARVSLVGCREPAPRR